MNPGSIPGNAFPKKERNGVIIMRITRSMLENYVLKLNSEYDLSLSVKYFNGCTHLYNSGYAIEVGSTPQCYHALLIFIKGFKIGMNLAINNEVI